MNAWAFVSELKPGDLVIVENPSYPRSQSVARVEKRTKLHVIVAGKKFRLSGCEVGNGMYRRSLLRQATPEAVETVRNAVAVQRYRDAFRALDRTEDAARVLACGKLLEDAGLLPELGRGP